MKTTTTSTLRAAGALAALAAAGVLLLAACGGGGTGAMPSAGPASGRTVSVTSVDRVGDVLVDPNGAALYAADQEANGTVACTTTCTSTWEPLTLHAAAQPTGEGGLAAKLGVVRRPGGARQVTFDGRPLYRFAEDPGPATVTGNGVGDSFGGRSFTWHVATPTGISTTSANSGSGSSRGYGY